MFLAGSVLKCVNTLLDPKASHNNQYSYSYSLTEEIFIQYLLCTQVLLVCQNESQTLLSQKVCGLEDVLRQLHTVL